MTRVAILPLLLRLADPAARSDAARELAAQLGGEELLLLVRDRDLERLLPAQGQPQTLHGGTSWRQFVRDCPRQGELEREVELPRGRLRRARVWAQDRVALVLLGGTAPGDETLIGELLPLLATLLRQEQDYQLARAEAQAARALAQRSHELAQALEHARADAARLNAELREEHRRKDEFLAMLGHELRNPLAPLRSSIELLRLGRMDSTLQRRQVEVMSRQIGHIAHLVDDLLDVSRVSRGQIELLRQRLHLSQVIDDAREEARPLLEQRGHQLAVRLGAEDLLVNGDRTRLLQVFANLLTNAAKYTAPGGRIELSCARDGDEAVVRVRDNGIGISSELLPRVFDLFMQVPGTLDRAEGGLGIGLTLVKNLVQLHGGSVAAHSEGLGLGSCFEIRLPLTQAAPLPAPRPPAPEPAQETPADAAAVAVLVVDDNRDGADAVAQLIRLLGHEVRVAYGGEDALALAQDARPELVLLDIGLPGMNGYEVARHLRRRHGSRLRLVAVTGYGSEDVAGRAGEAGFDDHMLKPVSLEALQALLDDTVRQRPLAAGA